MLCKVDALRCNENSSYTLSFNKYLWIKQGKLQNFQQHCKARIILCISKDVWLLYLDSDNLKDC